MATERQDFRGFFTTCIQGKVRNTLIYCNILIEFSWHINCFLLLFRKSTFYYHHCRAKGKNKKTEGFEDVSWHEGECVHCKYSVHAISITVSSIFIVTIALTQAFPGPGSTLFGREINPLAAIRQPDDHRSDINFLKWIKFCTGFFMIMVMEGSFEYQYASKQFCLKEHNRPYWNNNCICLQLWKHFVMS